jgi:hypothetical protein
MDQRRNSEMTVTKTFRTHVSVVWALMFVFAFGATRFGLAQDGMRPYVLSEIVQAVASMPDSQEYKVLREMAQDYPEVTGAERVVLYLDALTAADMIAKTRAALLRSERKEAKFLREDVELSFGWFCFPFGPPHKKKRELKDVRKLVIENMYTSLDKRRAFRNSINRDLLRLSKGELTERELDIFDVLDIDKLLTR